MDCEKPFLDLQNIITISKRAIFVALLMTLPIQSGARSLNTAVKAFVSDAQLEFEQEKYVGRLNGVSLSADYEISPNFFFKYEAVTGGGSFAKSTNEYKFSQNLVYAYKSLDFDHTPFPGWHITYAVGAGVLNKQSEFRSNTYQQSQRPLFLRLEITNSSNVKISLSGFAQIDNVEKNRSGSLSFKFPTWKNVSLIGKYTNHTSKFSALQHCGSDYFLGFSRHF